MQMAVIARDRTVWMEDCYTIREAMQYLKEKGHTLSLRRTFQFYGLHYNEERSFTSRYRQEFNLSKTKTMYDIRLNELRIYKDTLVGFRVR
jgi:hypothetical protein